MKAAIILSVGLFMVSGCASATVAGVQNSSAHLIGVPPEQVTITKLQGDRFSGYSWIATTASGVYNCDVDYMLRHPQCNRAAP